MFYFLYGIYLCSPDLEVNHRISTESPQTCFVVLQREYRVYLERKLISL